MSEQFDKLMKRNIPKEVANFLQSTLPAISSSVSASPMLQSFLHNQEDQEEEKESRHDHYYQLSLVRLVADFVKEQKEAATMIMTTPPPPNENNSTCQSKMDAVKKFKEALKSTQWISGFLFGNSDSVLSKNIEDRCGDDGAAPSSSSSSSSSPLNIFDVISSLFILISTTRTKDKITTTKTKTNTNISISIIQTWLVDILQPSIACLSNGALCHLQLKQYNQAERWCRRGIIQAENVIEAFEKFCCQNTREVEIFNNTSMDMSSFIKSVINLNLKLHFRLGQALEGQNDFDAAIGKFEQLINFVKKVKSSIDDNNNSTSKDEGYRFLSSLAVNDASMMKMLDQAMNVDAPAKIAQCREKKKTKAGGHKIMSFA